MNIQCVIASPSRCLLRGAAVVELRRLPTPTTNEFTNLVRPFGCAGGPKKHYTHLVGPDPNTPPAGYWEAHVTAKVAGAAPPQAAGVAAIIGYRVN